MSYQVLARKYRPKSFQTLVGQEHVVRALTHALEQKRLHHAYLFTGTRGVGKTTLSRILAKSLNCEQGITATPCGQCEACVAIDAGRFVDYIEMDAASNRGVDEMAQLLEQAIYAPSNARFKVYMIDEVHMLTNHAFNAMLKTLEEPPEHIKFILATTDPQKIPVTVLSRCLQFNLKQMPPGHIIGHLDNILNAEHIEFEAPALRLLAQGAHGSMRDALSLTDQAIAYAAGKVTLEAVQGMLGALDQSYLIRILDALADQEGATLMAVADEMAARSLSYHAALQDLATLLHRIALAHSVPTALAEDIPDRDDMLRLAARFDPEEIQLFYQIAVHGRNELGLAPDEYAGFSMTLLRMLAFRPGMGGGDASAPTGSGHAARALGAATARSVSRATHTASHAPTQGAALTAVPSSHAAGLTRSGGVPLAAAAAAEPVVAPSVSAPVQHAAGPVSAHAGANLAAAPVPDAEPMPEVTPAPAYVPDAETTRAVQADAPVARLVSSTPDPMPGNPRLAALQAARALGGKKAPAAARPALVAVAPADSAESSSTAQVKVSPPDVGMPVADAPQAPVQQDVDAIGAPPEPPPFDEYGQSAPPPWEQDVGAAVSSAVAADPSEQVAATTAPAPMRMPAREALPFVPYVPTAVPEIGWDGNWPALAAELPVRGVAQQLAQQSELVNCTMDHDVAVLRIRVGVETLLSSGSVDKLTAALTERFSRSVRVVPEIGHARHTANAAAVAAREERQREAEQAISNDPFVQALAREFGASVVAGSVRPL